MFFVYVVISDSALALHSRSAWAPRPPSLFEAKSQLASPPAEFTFALSCKQQSLAAKETNYASIFVFLHLNLAYLEIL